MIESSQDDKYNTMSGDLIQHNETILKLENKTNVLALILDVKPLKDANEWHLYKHAPCKSKKNYITKHSEDKYS